MNNNSIIDKDNTPTPLPPPAAAFLPGRPEIPVRDPSSANHRATMTAGRDHAVSAALVGAFNSEIMPAVRTWLW
jgi:hypothetical protein